MHAFRFLTALTLAAAFARLVQAEDWPTGYVVAERSTSPDGRFGILVEGKEKVLKDEEESTNDVTEYVNYLADLKAHRLLGKIEGSDYFEHQNHRDLHVQWSTDSKLCVATYWGRFGFGTIIVLEPIDDHFNQLEIGERVQKESDAATKQAGPDPDSVYIAPYFRFEAGGKIKVRAVGQNNPKQLDNVKTYYTFFRGTYDYSAKKWTAAEARTTTAELNEHLDSVLAEDPEKSVFVGTNPPDTFEGTLVASEEEKVEVLDQTLNHIYQALRLLLPPGQFAKLKKEEKDWAAKFEAAASPAEKSALLASRIRTLQDVLWQ